MTLFILTRPYIKPGFHIIHLISIQTLLRIIHYVQHYV